MNNNIKKDNELMCILDLSEISRVICNTNKSYLTLKLRKGEKEYWLHLDSVPLSKEDNKEVMELLYPKVETVPQVNVGVDFGYNNLSELNIQVPKKKAGRPKPKSK